MNKLFECADSYIKDRDWKMMAAVKFCVASMGILIGLFLPAKYRKLVIGIALPIFIISYCGLMADFASFAMKFFAPPEEISE